MRTASPEDRRAAHLALAGSPGISPKLLPGHRGDQDLTFREQQIAELAAAGLRTTEIAEELVISPKTVEYHLGKIYRKLGARSRTELAHRLSVGAAPALT
jgi:DNA-binding NarL/FixJ family response regulator